MAGRVQWEAQVNSNVKQLLSETKQLHDELDGIKKGNYDIKLNIDEKKLEKVISNLDKMLESLGKGTGNFKEFENLCKQLKDIISEVQMFNKAFSGINDSGISDLVSSIQNIDKSLSSLSEHISSVNKDFSNIGKNAINNVGQINEAKKATEDLADATKELSKNQASTDSSVIVSDVNKITQSTNQQVKSTQKATNAYKNQAYELASVLKMLAKLDGVSKSYADNLSKVVKSSASTFKNGNSIQFAALKNGFTEEMIKSLRGLSVNLSGSFNYTDTLGLDTATISDVGALIDYFRELLKSKIEFNNTKLNTSDIEELIKALGILKKEHLDDGTKTGRNVYDGYLDKYSNISEISSYLKQQEQQALATAEAERRLSEAEQNIGNSAVAESQNRIQEELKETQEIVEQTSNALSKVGTDKSNISSRIINMLPTDSEFKNTLAKLDLTKSKLNEIIKITRQAHADPNGKFFESFTLTDKYGSTETYGANSKTDKGQLLNYKYVEQNIKAAEQEAKALLEVQKRITKEIDHQTSIQQKKWQSFQKEQQNYISQKQETEANKRNIKAYQELVNSIQKYSEIKKRIANGKTFGNDIVEAEKLESKISELQKQQILSPSQIDASEQKLIKLYDELDIIEKKINQSNIDNISSHINSFQAKVEDYSKRTNQSAEYTKQVQKLKNAISELRVEQAKLSNIEGIGKKQENRINKLTNSCKEYISTLQHMSAAEKGSNEGSRMKMFDKISEYMKKNTRMSKEFREELESLLHMLQRGNASVNVENINTQFIKIKDRIRAAKQEGQSFIDIFKTKVVYGFASKLAMYYLSFYDFIRYARNAVNTLIELDTALVDLKKTTTMTNTQLEDFYYSSNDVAKQMGVTTKEIIDQASAWSRLNKIGPLYGDI